MKKLLVFTLILCLASMAGATLQISVNGNPDPIDSTIVLKPSDEIIIDIHNVGAPLADSLTMALIVDTAAGTLSGGITNPAYDGSGNALVFLAGPYGDPVPPEERPFPMLEGKNGGWGGIAVFSGSIPADTWLVDQVIFHCHALGDAVIELIKLDDASGLPTGVVYDRVIIHQIPEPATMLLLSLGGLLLRKK